MDKNSNAYVVLFAVAICVACSAALALTFNGLKDAIDANEAFDRQRNVLKAVGYWDPARDDLTRKELEALYDEGIERLVIERETGEVVAGKSPAELEELLAAEKDKRDLRDRKYLEVYRGTRGGKTRYVIPTLAYGLWSWLYGYLALNESGTEVVGITYYQHGETPGLGGEVDNRVWQLSWSGKKIFDDTGDLVSVALKKGRVNPDDPYERAHYVDGLSGATITSNGVTKYTRWNLQAYQPFFERVRKE